MTITLTLKDYWELLREARQNKTCELTLEPFEHLCEMPRQLGKGHMREIEVYPELLLDISEEEYRDDLLIKAPVSEHPLQFVVLLSGKIKNEFGQIGEGYSLISGGGIQNKMTPM